MSWGERGCFYLGRTLVLFRLGRGEIRSLAAGPDLEHALRDIRDLLPRSATLEVQWSAAYAPLLEVQYPADMYRWRDRKAFARALCARQLGVPASALVTEFDARCPSLVAVLLEEHRAALSALGAHRIRSARPLWSVLTTSRWARPADAVCVQEPDGLTLLGLDAQQRMRGASATMSPGAAASLRHTLCIPAAGIASVCLQAQAQADPPSGLPCWRGHWSVA